MTTSQPILNCRLDELDVDVFHHLGFSTKSFDFKEKFGDIKKLASITILLSKLKNLDLEMSTIQHGIGIPSTLILMHELTKLLHYAKCKNVLFIRLGTSGGLGVKPGTVVLSNSCVNTKFEPYNELCILGKTVRRPTEVDISAIHELKKLSENLSLKCSVVIGGTMSANDFYEEQARLDGAICTYNKKQKLDYLQSAYDHGIRNMEMEGTAITAHCKLVGHRAILVCVTLVNRLTTDQITLSKEEYESFELLPGILVEEYLKKYDGIIIRH